MAQDPSFEHTGAGGGHDTKDDTIGHNNQSDQLPPIYAGHDNAQYHDPITHPSTDDAQHYSISYPSADDATPNIIIFGETGVGKSSLINMITSTDSAATSNEAVGCTFQSTPYDVKLKSRKYRLWDTIGLNEGDRGTASSELSIQHLQRLVQNLQNGGVSLLVYCIRGSRIRDIIKINYDLFWKIICNKQVPIALVITGLENEEDMESWWTNNREDFARRGMQFCDHACVTTTKGKRTEDGEYIFESEFEVSVQLVQKLIVNRCPKTPWKADGSQRPVDIVQKMKQMFLQTEAQRRPGGVRRPRSPGSGERYESQRGGVGNRYSTLDLLVGFFQYIVVGVTRLRGWLARVIL